MMNAIGLFIEWILLEADHERALAQDDWNILCKQEFVWELLADAADWVPNDLM